MSPASRQFLEPAGQLLGHVNRFQNQPKLVTYLPCRFTGSSRDQRLQVLDRVANAFLAEEDALDFASVSHLCELASRDGQHLRSLAFGDYEWLRIRIRIHPAIPSGRLPPDPPSRLGQKAKDMTGAGADTVVSWVDPIVIDNQTSSRLIGAPIAWGGSPGKTYRFGSTPLELYQPLVNSVGLDIQLVRLSSQFLVLLDEFGFVVTEHTSHSMQKGSVGTRGTAPENLAKGCREQYRPTLPFRARQALLLYIQGPCGPRFAILRKAVIT